MINSSARQRQGAGLNVCHAVLARLVHYLSNPRIRHSPSGDLLPFVLHSRTVSGLRAVGIPQCEIDELEAAILDDVPKLPNYEIVHDAPGGLFTELKRANEIDLIVRKGAVPLPGALRNSLICEALRTEFTRPELLASGVFIESDDGRLRLDIDPWLARRGFLVPVIECGLIVALRVFRNPRDERPFVLRARREAPTEDIWQ